MRLLIVAEPPNALVKLGGITLLERLLRQMQRLDFSEAIILTSDARTIAANLARPSKPRDKIAVRIREAAPVMREMAGGDALVLSAGFYYDARLLRALSKQNATTILANGSELADAAFVSENWFAKKISDDENIFEALWREAARLETASVPSYIAEQRREIHPRFFSAPNESKQTHAESILRNTTQKGVLDFPAYIHAPIESWIVARLCQTSITPNQITFTTALLGLCVTIFFARGFLCLGTLFALAIGVLDGCDGKLARLKVETTTAGKFEHLLDHFIELSWWAALAFHFWSTREVPRALLMIAALFVLDWAARLMKAAVQRRIGRALDDASPFDRAFRFIAARRNVYIWILAASLLLGAPVRGFEILVSLGFGTALIQIARGLQICLSTNSHRAV